MTLNIMKYNNMIFILFILFFVTINVSEATVFNTGVYPGESFIDPTVTIDVTYFSIGNESYIAPFTSFLGDYAYVGSYSDIQDGVSTSGGININDDAVIAHGAQLSGNVEIGRKAFIGFNSIVKDSKIADGAYIGIGSTVIGIDIPAGKSVPAGSVIDSPDDIVNLYPVDEAQIEFVEEVIGVNRALAIGYSRLFEKSGREAFGNIGPNGDADILIDGKDVLDLSGSHTPSVGEGTVIGSSRVIGDVILGKNVSVGDGTSMRGDEGAPLKIGDNSNIGENDTFHSLNGQEISIGSDFKLGSKSVIHGPLTIGSDVRVGSSAVVFKSTIGNNVVIGDNAVVVGVKVPDGMVIPSGSLITLQKEVRKLNPDEPVSKTASLLDLTLVAMIPIALGLTGSLILKNKK